MVSSSSDDSLPTSSVDSDNAAQLDWVKLNTYLETKRSEGLREKMIRKTKENPFVPIGVLVTTVVLFYGINTMRTGNRKMSQYMMRARVIAQGLTVAALIGGIAIAGSKKKRESTT